jgi:hypothetical protein
MLRTEIYQIKSNLFMFSHLSYARMLHPHALQTYSNLMAGCYWAGYELT